MLAFIKNNEQQIRNFYAKTSDLGSTEFVGVILNDAIFIIELFWRYFNYSFYASDYLINNPSSDSVSPIELLKLENQHPYFILEELYRLAYVSPHHPTFMELSCNYFDYEMCNGIPRCTAVVHFTDLIRIALLKNYSKVEPNGKSIANLPCAAKLYESGVKFKGIKRECLRDIRFERRLIDTGKYVDLLIEGGIVISSFGGNASISNMFNKLCSQTGFVGSCYYHLCEELKAHYNNPLNHTKATLNRVYFSNLWKGTATVAAGLLLLLTMIQAMTSIKQVA
ncbi:uncharacterized protein LOC116115209 [Pistacia vera]|uniref:uncharacterized protein LOC116115209 n=1 Tax=Pistacia vera TaxID=55513 RepID=UPI001263BFAE|nr:uncharacterized protein LOC116115209 [Pistacia vera]